MNEELKLQKINIGLYLMHYTHEENTRQGPPSFPYIFEIELYIFLSSHSHP